MRHDANRSVCRCLIHIAPCFQSRREVVHLGFVKLIVNPSSKRLETGRRTSIPWKCTPLHAETAPLLLLVMQQGICAPLLQRQTVLGHKPVPARISIQESKCTTPL